MKKIYCLLLLSLLTITACTTQDGTIYAPTTQENTSAESDAETSAEYSGFDLTDTWDLETSTTILLDGEAAQISGDGATLAEGALLIDQEGTYVLQGEISGKRSGYACQDRKGALVLDGVNINCSTTAAINITSADKVVVTLAPGSENTLVRWIGLCNAKRCRTQCLPVLQGRSYHQRYRHADSAGQLQQRHRHQK